LVVPAVVESGCWLKLGHEEDAAAVELLKQHSVTRLKVFVEEEVQLGCLKPLAGTLQCLTVNSYPLFLSATAIAHIVQGAPNLQMLKLCTRLESCHECTILLRGLPFLEELHVASEEDVGYAVTALCKLPHRQIAISGDFMPQVLQPVFSAKQQ
jgi:hypothetical protein